MSETSITYARQAELALGHAENILDGNHDDRHAHAHALATIALTHAVLAVANAIDGAALDAAERAAVISR